MELKQADLPLWDWNEFLILFLLLFVCDVRDARSENEKMKSTQIKIRWIKLKSMDAIFEIGMRALNGTDRRRKSFKCREPYDNR